MVTDDWFAACIDEAQAFLDQFEEFEHVAVHRDSDIVAALIGILAAAPLLYMMDKHVEYARAFSIMLANNPRPGSAPSPEPPESAPVAQ